MGHAGIADYLGTVKRIISISTGIERWKHLP